MNTTLKLSITGFLRRIRNRIRNENGSRIDRIGGEVRISEKENIIINSNNYTKREKIFIDGRSLNTKPKCLEHYLVLKEIITRYLINPY